MLIHEKVFEANKPWDVDPEKDIFGSWEAARNHSIGIAALLAVMDGEDEHERD